MNENVIEFLRDAKMASVTFCQGRYISKVKKLAEQFPDECQIVHENPDGSILAHLPVKWIKINNPAGNSKEYTEEERQILRERLENARRNKAKIDSSNKKDS